jgi:hypothetical protein
MTLVYYNLLKKNKKILILNIIITCATLPAMNKTNKRFLQFALAGLLTQATMTMTAVLAIHLLPAVITMVIGGPCFESCKPLAFGALGFGVLTAGLLVSAIYLHYFMKVSAVSAAAIIMIGYFSASLVTNMIIRFDPSSALFASHISWSLTILSFACHGLLFDAIKTEKQALVTGIALALGYATIYFI